MQLKVFCCNSGPRCYWYFCLGRWETFYSFLRCIGSLNYKKISIIFQNELGIALFSKIFLSALLKYKFRYDVQFLLSTLGYWRKKIINFSNI